jgi:glycosyltransferase involved in cell wall biosynthesis
VTNPLISIIISCYNAELYVGDAIRSALAQRYRPIELIVIDDGSEDRSVAVIRSFGEMVRFESIKNGGAAAARNHGIEVARGELIQFLDADDVLYPEKLQRMAPLALKHHDSMVFSNALVIDMASGQRLGIWGRTFFPGMDPVEYVFGSTLQTAAPLHLKENLVRVGGFRPEMLLCEDPDLHFRLAASGLHFRHLPELLFTVRRVSGSLSKRDLLQGIRMEQKLGLDAVSELERLGTLNDERSRAISGFLASSGRRAIRHGWGDLADELFRQARSVHSSGGLDGAYSRRTRVIRRLVGPVLTERLVGWKRWLRQERAVG